MYNAPIATNEKLWREYANFVLHLIEAHLSCDLIQQFQSTPNSQSQEKEPAILSGTINSHFDVPATKRLSIDQALTAASAMDILDSLDGDGYSAEVVERGRTLSGGQRQRLSLARSLYVDAPILILDDPTSAVDAHTEARIAARLREVRNHQTTIIFTTSPLILDHTDRVILLVNGYLKNTGTHQNLLTTDNTYRDLVVRGD